MPRPKTSNYIRRFVFRPNVCTICQFYSKLNHQVCINDKDVRYGFCKYGEEHLFGQFTERTSNPKLACAFFESMV